MTAADPLAEAEAAFLSGGRWRDPLQHLTLCDWLDEHGWPQEAALRRILVEPGEDRHRLDFAGLLEREGRSVVCRRCKGRSLVSRRVSDDDVGRSTITDDCPNCNGTGRAAESDAARAEFCRVQVELARLPGEKIGWRFLADGTSLDAEMRAVRDESPQRERLRRRERELLEAYGFSQYPGSKWVNAECPELWRLSDRGATFAFRRGFVAALTLTAADLMQHAAAVFAAQPIEEVTLSCRNASPGTRRILSTWFANRDRDDVPDPADSNWLPWSIAVGLGMDHAQRRAYPRFERYEWHYDDCRSADAALSTAAVAYGRSAAHLPPLPARGPAAG